MTEEETCVDEGYDKDMTLIKNGNSFKTKKKSVKYRYNHDSNFRKQIQLSVFLGYIAFSLGWVKGQVGPTFPDILFITNTTLERGSAFITSFYIGRVVGSLSGVLYDKCNRHLFLAAVCMSNGVVVALIPWCSSFEAMVAVYLFHGAFAAATDVGSTAASFTVWGRRTIVFYQAYQFLISVGGILSPLAVAPFLRKTSLKHDTLSSFGSTQNLSYSNYSYPVLQYNSTEMNNDLTGQYAVVNTSILSIEEAGSNHQKSILYIAYLIAAFLVFLAGVPFIFYCRVPMETENDEEEIACPANKDEKENITLRTDRYSNIARNLAILNSCLFGGLYTAVELGMGNFLTVFCLLHLEWSKLDSVLAVSVFYLLFMVGRLLGIVIVKMFRSLKLLWFYTTLSILVFAAFLVCSFFYSDTGVWISIASAGLALSILFPTAVSWTNKTVAPVLGTITTLIFVTSYVGPFINPPLLSFLMESYGYMCFCYVLLIECGLMFMTVIVMTWYGKRHKRINSRNLSPENKSLQVT